MPREKKKENVKQRRVTMTLEAPEADQVSLMGDFNEWNVNTHPMKKNKRGVWEKAVMLPPGRYEYKFLVDGQWRNDPKNCDYCLNCL